MKLKLAVAVAALGGLTAILPASGASAANATTTSAGAATGEASAFLPCSAHPATWGLNEGAYSSCVAGTFGYEHRVWVGCSGAGGNYTSYGPWVGGTSRSERTCIGFDNVVSYGVNQQIQTIKRG